MGFNGITRVQQKPNLVSSNVEKRATLERKDLFDTLNLKEERTGRRQANNEK